MPTAACRVESAAAELNPCGQSPGIFSGYMGWQAIGCPLPQACVLNVKPCTSESHTIWSLGLTPSRLS